MSAAQVFYSNNELNGLLRRVFEALMGGRGDFAAAAEAVCWLELRGLNATRQLNSEIDVYQKQAGPTPGNIEAKSGSCGTSISVPGAFSQGFLAFDLAIGEALAREGAIYRIKCEGDRRFALPGLAQCGQAGLHAAAYWENGDNRSASLATIQAGCANPTCFTLTNQQPDLAGKIMLIISKKAAFVEQALLSANIDKAHPDTIVSTTAEEFDSRVLSGLRDGIPIDTDCLKRLSSIADRVLVESSEQSRRGAGD